MNLRFLILRAARGAAATAAACIVSLACGCATFGPPGVFERVIREELVYAERAGGPLLMTVYRPPTPGEIAQADQATPGFAPVPRPMVLLFHGGAFYSGSREELAGLGEALARQGFVAASVSYRLAPEHPFPAAVQDAFAAVRYLRSRAGSLGGDPYRMAAMGLSAGGYLAQFVGYCDNPDELFAGPRGAYEPSPCCGDPRIEPRVQAVITVYGPCELGYNLERAWPWARRAAEQFVGCKRDEDPELWALASPITHIDSSAAVTLSIHGRRDTVVGFEQTQRLAQRLERFGVPHAVVSVPAGHGWGYSFGSKDSYAMLPAVTSFLVRTLECEHSEAVR